MHLQSIAKTTSDTPVFPLSIAHVTTNANITMSPTVLQKTYFLIPLSPFTFNAPLAQSSYSDIFLITDVETFLPTLFLPWMYV